MNTSSIGPTLASLFAELTVGPRKPGEAYILNSGDVGLLASLDRLDATAASRSVNGGACVAAHAQHVRYGLSLMNRWALEGGNPFEDATWEDAWKLSRIDDADWREIRAGLHAECARWRENLAAPRDAGHVDLSGMIGSIAHLAYHLGAIRQIDRSTRGPREGTYATRPAEPKPR